MVTGTINGELLLQGGEAKVLPIDRSGDYL